MAPPPLAVIDFEASALDSASYPIEVGVAIAPGGSEPTRVWSTLIAPAAQWTQTCEWDPDAENIHGISRRDLRTGLPPAQAAHALNALLEPLGTAWCDGGHYDDLWLGVLFAAAGLQPAFELRALADLIATRPGWAERYRARITRDRPPHRAGPDAERILKILSESVPKGP